MIYPDTRSRLCSGAAAIRRCEPLAHEYGSSAPTSRTPPRYVTLALKLTLTVFWDGTSAAAAPLSRDKSSETPAPFSLDDIVKCCCSCLPFLLRLPPDASPAEVSNRAWLCRRREVAGAAVSRLWLPATGRVTKASTAFAGPCQSGEEMAQQTSTIEANSDVIAPSKGCLAYSVLSQLSLSLSRCRACFPSLSLSLPSLSLFGGRLHRERSQWRAGTGKVASCRGGFWKCFKNPRTSH